MNLTADQVLDAALALPDNDRFELVEALLVSLQPGDRAPLDDSWRDVVRRRSAELRSGKVKPIPWEEVKRHPREKANGTHKSVGGLLGRSRLISGRIIRYTDDVPLSLL